MKAETSASTPLGAIPPRCWIIILGIFVLALVPLVTNFLWEPKGPQTQIIQIPSGIAPAASMPLAEGQTLDFVPHGTTRDGVPFYAWTNPVGKRVDVFVMRDPETGEPRLFSFPADRVGGSEGPAEPPVVTGSETSDRQPQIGPK